MKKINIVIKQISDKNSVQNIIFGGDENTNKNLETKTNAKNIQNIDLGFIVDDLQGDDKFSITIINKKQKISKKIKTNEKD